MKLRLFIIIRDVPHALNFVGAWWGGLVFAAVPPPAGLHAGGGVPGMMMMMMMIFPKKIRFLLSQTVLLSGDEIQFPLE
jgi:hypothetical protein